MTPKYIPSTRAPYAELRALLKQLDYHPLAIQLVLPQLQHLSLQTIRTEFAALLLKFKDDTATGSNSSILASLDCSLRRLSQEQKDLLPRLSIFEGGAMEDDLLAITEIPEQVWTSLRPALEQAALLTAEQVHVAYRVPFLHFHPVLIPYLRSQSKEEDVALRERYAQRYYAVANYYYQQDNQYPEPVRAVVRRELPNLRKALELLLRDGDVNDASEIADRVIKFLNIFGLTREIEQVRRRVTEVMEASSQTDANGGLTRAKYLHELGLAQDARQRGDIRTAYKHLTSLLTRIEATPEGTPRGRGSYQHCRILVELALCFKSNGQLKEAEEKLREALSIIDALLSQDTENQYYINQRGTILCDLGDILGEQGEYIDAKEAYEQALTVHTSTNNLRGQAVVSGQLGNLALRRRNFDEAQSRYLKALDNFRTLGEPEMQAVAWHQLGRVAEEQKEWAEAERCYRESLAIRERLGDTAGVAQTCNQLAIVAESAGRPVEAEGWYKRTIKLDEQVQAGSLSHAMSLNNLAVLLVTEVTAGRAAKNRLVEARRYAEQAKIIKEQPGVSAEIWTTFSILAQIADLEERPEEAQDYRRRERESSQPLQATAIISTSSMAHSSLLLSLLREAMLRCERM